MHRLLFTILLGLSSIVRAETISADVLVYGATPAGVCAAVGAAREGASVLLIEPSSHVGGVNSGGLSFSDSNQMWRVALRGLFEEFHQRIEDDYNARGVKLPYTVAEKDQKVWTYEPHVAAWTGAASPATTVWLWNTEQGWARLDPVMRDHGWRHSSAPSA